MIMPVHSRYQLKELRDRREKHRTPQWLVWFSGFSLGMAAGMIYAAIQTGC